MNIQNAVKKLLFGAGAVAVLVFGLGGWYFAFQNPGSEACNDLYDTIDPDRVGYLGPKAVVTLAEKGYRLTGCGIGSLELSSYDLYTPNCTIIYDHVNHDLTLWDGGDDKRIYYKLYGEDVDSIPSLADLKQLSPGFAHC